MFKKQDKKILEECCKISLLEEVDRVRNKELITKKQSELLKEKIKNLPYSKTLNLLFREGEISELEPEEKKSLKYSLAMGTGVYSAKKFAGKIIMGHKVNIGMIKAAAIGAIALFIFRKFSNPCFREAAKLTSEGINARRIHFHKCQADASKRVIAKLVPRLSDCAIAKNPSRCHSELSSVINHWKEKYHQEILALSRLEKAEA